MAGKAGFGAEVSTLLDLYGRCLRLLKSFPTGSDGDSAHSRNTLRSTVRGDRAKVRKAYSSQLSRRGGRLAKGDGASKSALRRILDRLRRIMAEILRPGQNQGGRLDYASLTSLSNASRTDTVRVINQLSQRMSSSSCLSSSSSSSSSSSTRSARASSSGRKSKRRTHAHSNGISERHRISYVSMSSDSTKLGEIPQRRSKPRHSRDRAVSSRSEEYMLRPVYPLYAYGQPKADRQTGFLRRLFKGRDG